MLQLLNVSLGLVSLSTAGILVFSKHCKNKTSGSKSVLGYCGPLASISFEYNTDVTFM